MSFTPPASVRPQAPASPLAISLSRIIEVSVYKMTIKLLRVKIEAGCMHKSCLEGIPIGTGTRGAIDNAETLTGDTVGAGNRDKGAVCGHRGDQAKCEKHGREGGGLGEHDDKNWMG